MKQRGFLLLVATVVLCVVAPDAAQAQGYGGPSMLSRGGNSPGRRGRAPVSFNVYAGLRGTYDSGLLAPQLNDEGELEPVKAYGGQVEGGAYGGKDWSRNSIGLDYRGDYRYSSRYRQLNGTGHAISFSSQHRISRRMQLVLQQTGGTTNRAIGNFAAGFAGNASAFGVPLDELLDVRVYFLQSAAGLSYQTSARTTLGANAAAFFIKRKNQSLINGQGFTTQGQYAYRLNRLTTLQLQGGLIRFEYPGVYSDSNIYTINAGVSRRLTRNWDVSASAGLYIINSRGVEQVELNPIVAEILGRPTGRVAFERTQNAPMFQGDVSYTMERGRFQLSAMNGVTPGNGVMLTAERTGVGAGYSYSGLRRMSLGASASYMEISSLSLRLSGITQTRMGGGLNYRIAEYLGVSFNADWRKFESGSSTGRSGASIQVGLTYSPSSIPLSIF